MTRAAGPPLLLDEFLDWVAARPRSYADTVEAWRSNCPRHPVLDDAFSEGLIEVVDGRFVHLTEAGRAALRCQTPESVSDTKVGV